MGASAARGVPGGGRPKNIGFVPIVFYLASMVAVQQSRMVALALAVLEDGLRSGRTAPLAHSHGIALALAYLASVSSGERWPYDDYWKAMRDPDAKIRSQDMNRTLNGIYHGLKINRP